MGEYLAAAGVPQLAISETQKYGHVTYFWNGNRSGKIDDKLETYVEIPSDRIPFDQRPWMKAAEITDRWSPSWPPAATASPRQLRQRRHGRHTGTSTPRWSRSRPSTSSSELCGMRWSGWAVSWWCTADHGNADEMFTARQGGPRGSRQRDRPTCGKDQSYAQSRAVSHPRPRQGRQVPHRSGPGARRRHRTA
jgi:2,3-bisphosphoglycerate-independent phosphoglycerate mutase